MNSGSWVGIFKEIYGSETNDVIETCVPPWGLV